MSHPPSSDEGSSKESAKPAKKPATKSRSRYYKTKAAAKVDAPAELAFESPRPSVDVAPPTPPPPPAPEPVVTHEPERDDRRDDEAPSQHADSAPVSNGQTDNPPSDAPRQGEGNFDQGPDNQGGGGGYDRFQGGGGFFKKGKRGKRGRNKHFQGGGGGGHTPWQPRPQHPPQPPPPNLNVGFTGDLPDPARLADLAALEKTATELAEGGTPVRLDELYAMHLADLTAAAKNLGVVVEGAPNRKQLLTGIFEFAHQKKLPIIDRGWLDLTDRGFGFVVHDFVNYRLYPEDPYLPEIFVQTYGLKRGHFIEVQVQAPQGSDRCPSVVKINSVMGNAPEEISKIIPFEELVPYYPLNRIMMESPDAKDISMRVVDMLTPVGFGQRGLIVAPPRTGKTVLLQNLANSIAANHPEAKLIVLLVDERPEEVTDFRRHIKGEVVSSTFDESPESHIHCAEMVGEKARRLVEQGQHVVILLDSITRLARAYNALASNSGKIMSGGMEATAMQRPKRFFGAARNIEGMGSLTIIATALIDTGSRMDEVIFEEFKGTGNMELHLDRELSNKRIFPAINADRSGTRKEELIYHPEEMQRIYTLRRTMQGLPAIDAMELLVQRVKKTKTNAEFLMGLAR